MGESPTVGREESFERLVDRETQRRLAGDRGYRYAENAEAAAAAEDRVELEAELAVCRRLIESARLRSKYGAGVDVDTVEWLHERELELAEELEREETAA